MLKSNFELSGRPRLIFLQIFFLGGGHSAVLFKTGHVCGGSENDIQKTILLVDFLAQRIGTISAGPWSFGCHSQSPQIAKTQLYSTQSWVGLIILRKPQTTNTDPIESVDREDIIADNENIQQTEDYNTC